MPAEKSCLKLSTTCTHFLSVRVRPFGGLPSTDRRTDAFRCRSRRAFITKSCLDIGVWHGRQLTHSDRSGGDATSSNAFQGSHPTILKLSLHAALFKPFRFATTSISEVGAALMPKRKRNKSHLPSLCLPAKCSEIAISNAHYQNSQGGGCHFISMVISKSWRR